MKNFGYENQNNLNDNIELTDISIKDGTINDESSFIIEKEKDGNIRKFTISNCDNLESAQNFFKSSELQEELQHHENIFLIRFIISESFRELTQKEVEELKRTCKNNSILLTFESDNDKKVCILWSSKEIGHFLQLSPHKNDFGKSDKVFFKFVYNFLLESLKNGNLGIINTHSRSVDACNINVEFLSDSNNRNLYAIAKEQKNKEIQKYIAKNIPKINVKTENSVKRKICIILCSLFGLLVLFGIIVTFISFILYTPEYSFEKLSRNQQERIVNGLVNYNGIHVKYRDIFSDFEVYENFTSDHIANILRGQILNFQIDFKYVDHFVHFNWQNLSSNLRQKVLNSNANFQGAKVNLSDLFEIYPKAFDELNSDEIEVILNGNDLVIGSDIDNERNFHISRDFINEDIYAIYYEHKINGTKENDQEDFLKFYENFNQHSHKISQIKANPNFQEQLHSNFEQYFENIFNIPSVKINNSQIENFIEESRISVLTGEAGSGKSRALEHIAIDIKKSNPKKWVAIIDLSEYKESWNASTNENDIESFLMDIQTSISETLLTEFDLKIFESSYKSDNVVLIWDEFDSLSDEKGQVIAKIVKNIYKNTKNIQVVGTRFSASKLLKESLNASVYLIAPFNEIEIKEFLKEYLKYEYYSESENDEIESYVAAILEILQNLSDNLKIESFFKSPHILEAFADCFHSSQSYFESKNYFKIISFINDEIIEKWVYKYDTEDKYYSDDSFEERLMNVFQKFALKVKAPTISNQLTQIYVNQLRVMSFNESTVITIEDFTKMGILKFKNDRNFQFVDKIFVDFFITHFIGENIKDSDSVDNKELILIIQLLLDILDSKPEENQIIFKYLESYFESVPYVDESVFEVIKEKFSKILFNVFKKGYTRSFKLLLKILKNNNEVLLEMLQINQTETLYTASYNPVYFNDHYFAEFNRSELKNMVKELIEINDEDLEKFLKGKDQKGVILYGLYYSKENYDKILDYDVFGTDWVHEFELRRKNLLSSSNINKSSIKSINETVKHSKSEPKKLDNEEILKLVLYDNITQLEQQNLFLSKSSPIIDEKIISKDFFWNKVYEILSAKDIKELMIHVFDRIHRFKDLKNVTLKDLTEKLEDYLSRKEIFQLISNYYILHRAAANQEHFKILWDYFVSIVNDYDQEEILTQVSIGECYKNHMFSQNCYDTPPLNIFHIALLFGTNESIYEMIKDIYNASNAYTAIISSNSFLPYSIQLCNNDKFDNFLSFLNEKFSILTRDLRSLKTFLAKNIDDTNFDIKTFFLDKNDSIAFNLDNFKKFEKKISSILLSSFLVESRI